MIAFSGDFKWLLFKVIFSLFLFVCVCTGEHVCRDPHAHSKSRSYYYILACGRGKELLQIPSSKCIISWRIFQRTTTNNFTICMEIQKTLKSQSNLEKEELELEESIYLTSDYTTKLESSRQYGTGTKTEI